MSTVYMSTSGFSSSHSVNALRRSERPRHHTVDHAGNKVLLDVLTNTRELNMHRNLRLLEHVSPSDARQLQKLRGLQAAVEIEVSLDLVALPHV